VGLLADLTALLDAHPLGGNIQLMVATADVPLDADEVLVQISIPGERGVRLIPMPLAELSPDDLLHESQLLRLDEVNLPQARPKCLIRYPDGPNKPRHFHN
jgi:hypothetical protein